MTRRCARCAKIRIRLILFFLILTAVNLLVRYMASLPVQTTQDILLIPAVCAMIYALVNLLWVSRKEH